MKYFLDFEAAQYTNEIIAIGCVNERGETFYSLSKSEQKLNRFITNLTGITNEMLETAPTPDEVFSKFYNEYLDKDEKAEFYCYGDCDILFTRATLLRVNDFSAQSALSLIASNLVDYAINIKNHFELNTTISLIKVISYYRSDPNVIQNHNALEDAMFLKEIYDNSISELVDECPFPEYQQLPVQNKPTLNKVVIFGNNDFRKVFGSVEYLAEWLTKTKMRYQQPDIEKVCKRIKRCIKRKEKYCDYVIEYLK